MSGREAFQEAASYEPVMYKLVKEQERRNQNDESQLEIQQGFLDRTERLMRQHQQRSHIHDGLKELTNAEIINKVTAGPTKLKAKAKGFLQVLQKHGVYLDEDANPVYSKVKDENVRKFLEKRDLLVKTTLIQADLEFEYPQKLERLIVRADMLTWLDQEEEKLKNIALEEFMEAESQKKAGVKTTPGTEFYLTYDDYYGNKDLTAETSSRIKIGESGMIEKSMTFDEFSKENKAANPFDNDMIEQQYKFWETDLEKMQRLRKVWIDMNRRQALGGVDAVSEQELSEM